MGIFTRIFNIINADIDYVLNRLEERRFKRGKNSDHRDYNNFYDWDSFKHDNNSDYSSNTNYKHNNYTKNNVNYDEKLAQYYANLEIPYGSDLETAKKAWKNLMRKYHPDLYSKDKTKIELATKLSSKLNEAYSEIEKSLNAKKHNV